MSSKAIMPGALHSNLYFITTKIAVKLLNPTIATNKIDLLQFYGANYFMPDVWPKEVPQTWNKKNGLHERESDIINFIYDKKCIRNRNHQCTKKNSIQ